MDLHLSIDDPTEQDFVDAERDYEWAYEELERRYLERQEED